MCMYFFIYLAVWENPLTWDLWEAGYIGDVWENMSNSKLHCETAQPT